MCYQVRRLHRNHRDSLIQVRTVRSLCRQPCRLFCSLFCLPSPVIMMWWVGRDSAVWPDLTIFKYFADKSSFKSSPIVWLLLGYFENITFLVKNYLGTFSKNWATFLFQHSGTLVERVRSCLCMWVSVWHVGKMYESVCLRVYEILSGKDSSRNVHVRLRVRDRESSNSVHIIRGKEKERIIPNVWEGGWEWER